MQVIVEDKTTRMAVDGERTKCHGSSRRAFEAHETEVNGRVMANEATRRWVEQNSKRWYGLRGPHQLIGCNVQLEALLVF